MELKANKYLTRKLIETLEKDDWTMEQLSTATARDLAAYRGVGRITAQNIILEARGLVNEAKLHEAVTLQQTEEAPPPEEEPAVSVRVRRIKEMNRE